MILTIIYPADPLGRKVGGGETFLKSFINYAPLDIQIEYIGISSASTGLVVNQWTEVNLGEKTCRFFPLFTVKNENKKTIIPLALRYSVALKAAKFDYSKRVIFFNRIEPSIFFKNIHSPQLVIIHNDIKKQILGKDSEVFWSKFPWLYFKLERYLLQSMNFIYSVSQRTVEYYQINYPTLRNRISFLPTSVDVEIFQPALAPKAELRKGLGFINNGCDEKWVLFVGRLQEQKAPLRLIDAFRKFIKNNHVDKLIIIGEGNLQKKMENYVKQCSIQKQVIFLNGMDQKKLAKFYQAADVLLLTSNFEGMPMCVLEALGCGLPVVTTNVGEVKKVVKNGISGEIASTFEPTDIANALEKVIQNSSIYAKDNCLNCIADFIPQKVFLPVYEKIKKLYSERFG